MSRGVTRWVAVAGALCLLGCPNAPGEPGVAIQADGAGSDAGGGSQPDTSGGNDAGASVDLAPPPPPCANGVSCDDFDPCTIDDVCQNGVCQGNAFECEDGLECTQGICDGQGGCSHKVIAGNWCLIAGSCYGDGQLNPADNCQACVTPVSPSNWTSADGEACDDGQECTGDDACAGGVCKGQKNPCDDDNPCTTNGCKEGEGCIHAAVQGPCEDGDFCTVGDSCTNKVCGAGAKALDCSDGDPCTSDVCNEGGGCDHLPHSGPCEDGDPCTSGDECVQGECTPGSQVPSCDDGNPCTDDVCLHGKGCAHIPNLSPCDDGNDCTQGDSCSGLLCKPGLTLKDCSDGDPCTQDFCEQFIGCKYVPLTGNCDDGNPCTEKDKCVGGFCKGGTVASCNDDNDCTDDVCDAKVAGGCVFEPNSDACDDGDPCTEGDACQNGSCKSQFSSCDDGNPCTVDQCVGNDGCVHTADASTDGCLLKIVITSPKRAQTFTGGTTVTVKGKVTSPAAPVETATLNGKKLTLKADGSFTKTITVVHGMNVLHGQVTDQLGGKDKAVRAFYYSKKYQPLDPNKPKASSVDKALYLFLGPEAIDDGNHTLPANDLATIFEIIIGSFDIGALLPNPLVNTSDYKVTLSGVGFDPALVQLLPINGGLGIYASITNLKANISAQGKCTFCPSASGSISVSEIIIISDVELKTVNGAVDAKLKNTDVILINPDVNINGILGSILDFIVDFIVDQLAPTIENAFQNELGNVLPATIESALNSLAFDLSFEVPPFFQGAKAITISLKTGLEATFFDEDGGTLRMWGAATAPKFTTKSNLGVLRRHGCMSGFSESLNLTKEDPLQLALSDDLLNQIFYSMWHADGLKFPIPSALLADQDLTAFGVEDIKMDLDMLLPPIVTSCNIYNDLLLQIGDIQINIDAKLFGQPVTMELYASIEAFIELSADAEGLGLAILDLKTVLTEVEVQTAGLASAEPLVDGLIADQVAPLLLDQLGGGSLAGFPLPAIDLGGLADGVPEGTEIAIEPKKVLRIKGWSVVSGDIK